MTAYAIEYAELKTYYKLNESSRTEYLQGHGFLIKKDKIVWLDYKPDFLDTATPPVLTVHYHGIRDFRLLFPGVSTPERRTSLASYYEETEKCFDSGTWLSFMLMCGAIFEGLLFDRIGSSTKNKFFELIANAESSGVISPDEAELFDNVRRYRNLVHLNQAENEFVRREDVMDTRKMLDLIITRFSYLSSENKTNKKGRRD